MDGIAPAERVVCPDAESQVGRVIAGRYRLDAVLGSGAIGVVYRATHLRDGAAVAVKVPRPESLSGDDARRLFRREARAAARLSHPNSVRVLDVGEETDGLAYVVMDLVEGRDLFEVMTAEGPFDPARIAAIATQVLDALAAAHDAGVVHRDLKPENILVTRKGGEERALLTDFGVAKILEGSTSESRSHSVAGAITGTPTYIAPEQVLGEAIDGRADLYAVGVLLYELCCGAPPFEDDRPIDLVVAHVMRAPRPPSTRRAGVHAGLEAVAMRALAKKREARYADARAMRAAIEEAMGVACAADASGPDDEGDRPTLFLGPARTERQTSRAQADRAWWWASVALAAVLVALAVLTATAGHGGRAAHASAAVGAER
jgi:serine/threonine-protein kinase